VAAIQRCVVSHNFEVVKEKPVEKTKEDLVEEYLDRVRDGEVSEGRDHLIDELMRAAYISGWNECYARMSTTRSS
jgi:hypothetical protein